MATAKKTTKKAVSKSSTPKPSAKKAPAKKPSPKPAGKPAPKASAAAKARPSKPAPKPAASAKPSPAKAQPAASPARRAAEQAVPAKKAAARVGVKKSVAEAIAEILEKKGGSRAASVVKVSRQTSVEVVQEQSRPAENKGVRASAGIYFSMEDLENFLAGKAMARGDDRFASASQASSQESVRMKRGAPAAAPAPSVPKRALGAASIADILGFNPIEQSRTTFEEKDVPQKWKKYYRMLSEMRERFLHGPSDKAEAVSDNNGELSHENSTQGMDAADIGSKNFERDMAFSLMSSEQTLVSEINAAIERIRNGTYGVCEITGRPIPESRLSAIPFARCTIEGQQQKEAEMRRARAGMARSQYGVELGEDDASPSEISDDNGD